MNVIVLYGEIQFWQSLNFTEWEHSIDYCLAAEIGKFWKIKGAITLNLGVNANTAMRLVMMLRFKTMESLQRGLQPQYRSFFVKPIHSYMA